MIQENSNIPFGLQRFGQLFKEQFGPLCGFAGGYIRDADAAKEIVQEVFVNLWQRRETIEPGLSVKSYLFTSVRNRCLNYIRDHKKFQSYILDVETEERFPSWEPGYLEEEETGRKIESALAKLPEKCREVFELSRFEEMKYAEIAEKLGISVKTVEVHISKALRILREELKDLLMILLFLLFNSGK